VDDDRLAAGARLVVDPGLDAAGVLQAGAAALVQRVGDDAGLDDAGPGAGEGNDLPGQVRFVDADEAEADGVVTGIGVVELEDDRFPSLIGVGAGDPRRRSGGGARASVPGGSGVPGVYPRAGLGPAGGLGEG
jgi:hypothetical protein